MSKQTQSIDPQVAMYVASIMIPAAITVGSFTVSCVKQVVKTVHIKLEQKKLTKNIDEDYEELCKLMSDFGDES